MAEIITSKVIVLKKLDYGDTSKIATFFSEDRGKISAIIKGAKSPKSKTGAIIDPLNILEITYYNKPNREIQVLTQADLILHPAKITEDLDAAKFSSAAIELIDKMIFTGQGFPMIFKAIEKFIGLLNKGSENSSMLFAKFFLYFLKEIGYEPQLENCIYCGKPRKDDQINHFNYETGLVCDLCSKDHLTSVTFNRELFKLLNCLSQKNNEFNYSKENLDKILFFLEKYLMYHIPEFKGLKSLKMF